MSKTKPRIAVFPGSFDPLTLGHVDVIRRAAALFDELIVAVGQNPEKTCLLDQQTRARIVGEVVADLPNVRVETYDGLTVDAAQRLGAAALVRGIRSGADVDFELQLAQTNRAVAGIETVFIVTRPEHGFISSALIRQIAARGRDVSSLVPPPVLPALEAALRSR